MAIKVNPKFISEEMTTDTELSQETAQRISEDLTFLKLNGSRPMTGNLDMSNNDISGINKKTSKIVVTSPLFTTSTNSGTLNLSNFSNTVHFITGNGTNYSIVFPNAQTIDVGTNYEIYNRSTQSITLKYFDGSTLGILDPESVSSLILQDNATAKGIFSPFTVEVAQAAGIENYSLSASAPFTTGSQIDIQISGFTIVPKSGEYLILYNSSNSSVTNNSDNYVTLYKDGVALSSSERVAKATASNFVFILSTQAVISFNGIEQLRVYVRVSAGSLSVGNRTVTMLRLGPASL